MTSSFAEFSPILSSGHADGTLGHAALATLWYRRGLSLGDEDAPARLQPVPPSASHAAVRAERP